MRIKLLNLLATYHKASEQEIRSGMLWYAGAHDEAKRLAKEHDCQLRCSAAVIAAVSPGLRWERNVECAERIMRHETLNGLGVRWYDGVRKAKKILKGHNPDVVLKGNKVKAFHACILNPDNVTSVCVDGHAYSIWCGRRITLDEVPPLNDRLYSRIAGDYCEASRALHIAPCQLQAITWVTWRRLNGVTSDSVSQN